MSRKSAEFVARASRTVTGAALFVMATLVGCGAPTPKDYSGTWTPVNRFQTSSTEIPLSPAYTFYASPMDGTLQTMLKRWAADCGLQLNYQARSDFTLHQPVAAIRTVEIQAATGELNAIYAAHGITITADARRRCPFRGRRWRTGDSSACTARHANRPSSTELRGNKCCRANKFQSGTATPMSSQQSNSRRRMLMGAAYAVIASAMPSALAQTVQMYEYQPDRIYPVRVGLGISTQIELSPEEKFSTTAPASAAAGT